MIVHPIFIILYRVESLTSDGFVLANHPRWRGKTSSKPGDVDPATLLTYIRGRALAIEWNFGLAA